MTSDRRREARRVFMEVADLPAEEQAAALAQACAGDDALRTEVDALLQAEARAGGFMADPTSDATGAHDEDATIAAMPSERVGGRIGPYKLLQLIGEGGFGVVYMAEQETPVRRKVALKIIKLGMDTKQVIARFEAERQALAMMDHPNIAKVFDAGATETGRPYFVMELVKGEPITEYCDRHNLSVEDRLDLFQQTCNAVQHAHQKGIIHRDIKPSNVMITLLDSGPVPKVIDFGIAKATNQRLTEKTVFTEYRQFIGTPEYMSPEQAEMSGIDIDTRSDVYSLGVLLYELLTGTTPFDSQSLRSAGYGEIQRIIREETPHKPSTRVSTLDTLPSIAAHRLTEPKKLGLIIRGDLDWIVMKALEKDRTRRYETANGFAADIQRYLDSKPVDAGPPSAAYRMRKFIRRNRASVAAASLMACVLILGVVGTTWGMLWALDERDRADMEATNASLAAEAERTARLEAQRASEEARVAEAAAIARAEELESVAAFQSSQLGGIDVELMGARLRDAILAATPEESHAALLEGLSPVNFTSLALRMLQDNIFERTIDAIDAQFEEQPLVRARLLQTVADTVRELGLLDLANDPQTRALAIRRDALGDDHPDTLTSISNMGFLLRLQGRLEEAEPYYLEALEGSRRVLGDDHFDTLISFNNMGGLLQSQGRFEEAEPYYRRALEGRRRLLGDDHPSTLTSLNNVGGLLRKRERYDEAEPYYHEAMERRRRVLGPDHPSTLNSIGNMGLLLWQQGRLDEAEPYLREALEGRRRVLGDDHPYTLTSVNNMASLLRSRGRYDEAAAHCREAMSGFRRVLGDDHPSTLESISNMGALFEAQGRYIEAEPYYREALEVRRRVLGDDHPSMIDSIDRMSRVLMAQGRLTEAEPLWRELIERRTADADVLDAGPRTLDAAARVLLIGDVDALNDPRRALGYAKRACALEEAAGGTALPAYFETLARAHHMAGDAASAVDTQKRAIELVGESEELNATLAMYEASLADEPGVTDDDQP
ncbi:MAG: serine/threonine protein kinase [Phycisphaeraceae bacterium]|nr:serine/threonine protein kinase [Phycisphaerales bacterium]MCB9842832.1 serine/threonine protein kinase [Phycisphaeraceae bacterium]